jgi:hypothetical protein
MIIGELPSLEFGVWSRGIPELDRAAMEFTRV